MFFPHRNALAVAVAALLSAGITASALTLVKDGKAASVIVIAKDAIPVAKVAADELQYHLEKMSGVKLQIVTDDQAPKDMALILVGQSALTDNAGIDSSKLPPEGTLIKTVGNSLVIIGNDATNRKIKDDDPSAVSGATLFAAYGFLQDVLGVRWIWPGPTGEAIPKSATVEVSNLDMQDAPALERRHMRFMMNRDYTNSDKLFNRSATDATSTELSAQERIWYRRMRMGAHAEGPSGHSFRDFYKRFHGTENEDVLALLPNGKRGYSGKNPQAQKVCAANPKLWDILEEDFRQAHEKNPNVHALQLCEADGRAGHCTCPLCKAADATLDNTPADILESMPADLYEKLKIQKDGIPATVSTRYAKFLNEMARRVRKIDPDGYVTMYAMTRLRETPINIKMEPNIMVNYVGFNAYPMTGAERAAERRDFTGWITEGTKVVLRPNAPHSGGDGMPYNISREMADDFVFALNHGMVQAEYDAMLGYWASWGPTYYVLPRLMWNGAKTDPETLISEWYSAFGPAQREVRAFYDYWEQYIRATFDNPEMEALQKKVIDKVGNARGGRLVFFANVYTPEVMAHTNELLEAAKKAAENADDSVKEKLMNIELNQKNAEMTAKVAALVQASWEDPAKKDEIPAALEELLAFRRSIATRDAVNVYHETDYEMGQGGDPWGWKKLPEFNKAAPAAAAGEAAE